ncbi:isochorismatase family protein [Brevibacillus borstelensis]|uniref:isochorismatase family protein n=1 Tax=Brevibacillus borstelensis TaxID=45462 RepID=UPI003CC91D37
MAVCPGDLATYRDVVIAKQATDAFYQTPLKEEWKKRGITHLVIAGARTEYCVDTTCRSAISNSG